MKSIRPLPQFLAATVLAALFAGSVHSGEGIRLLPESAEALGMVGGKLTNLSDASVVRLNPANMSFIDGFDVMVSASLLHGNTEFLSPQGISEKMESQWKAIGGLYMVGEVEGTPWTLGLGVAAPYGLDMKWASDGAFAFILPHDIYLMPMTFTPSAALEINDRLSVGFGLDVTWSKLELTQLYPWSLVTGVPGTPIGIQEFEAEGWGVAPIAAINWEFIAGQRLSVVAKAPMPVDFGGDYSITNIPTPLGPLFSETSTFETELEYPGSVAVGYGLDLGERVRLGVDFEWIQNSVHDDLPLSIGTNQALLPADRVVLDWDNSWNLGFGAEMDLAESVVFRTGYMFSESPMPDVTFTPAVPANDRHLISFGIGLKGERSSIDFAYLLGIYEDREFSNNQVPAYNGEWEFLWHQFTVSYTFHF